MELYHGSNIEVAQPLALAGRITTEQALDQLKYKKPNNQICLRNQEVIDKFLHFKKAEILDA